MATNEGRIVTKFSKNKTGAKLLPEALAADLHVLEDEDMIRSLGRDKFVQLSIHGSQGWQEGVSKPSHKLFCCFWVLHSRVLGSMFSDTPLLPGVDTKTAVHSPDVLVFFFLIRGVPASKQPTILRRTYIVCAYLR